MDVHRPMGRWNGYGIVFVAGSGWQAPQTSDATPLKQSQIPLWGPALVAAGYTVFAIDPYAPRRASTIPAALEDVQRAVRFIRHHAKVYRIRSGPSGRPWRIVRRTSSRPRLRRLAGAAIPRIATPSTASRQPCRQWCCARRSSTCRR